MVEGVIPEKLVGQVVPDWLGAEFRLLREKSEQNRMHMPEGDYHGLYWWSRAPGGGNGTEDPVPSEKPWLPHSSRLRSPSQGMVNKRQRGEKGWGVSGGEWRVGPRTGGSTAKIQTKRGSGEGVSVALAVSSEGWKARRGVGGMGRGSSCRRLGRDGEMGERGTANDRLELAAEGWERRFGSWKNLEVMRYVSRDKQDQIQTVDRTGLHGRTGAGRRRQRRHDANEMANDAMYRDLARPVDGGQPRTHGPKTHAESSERERERERARRAASRQREACRHDAALGGMNGTKGQKQRGIRISQGCRLVGSARGTGDVKQMLQSRVRQRCVRSGSVLSKPKSAAAGCITYFFFWRGPEQQQQQLALTPQQGVQSLSPSPATAVSTAGILPGLAWPVRWLPAPAAWEMGRRERLAALPQRQKVENKSNIRLARGRRKRRPRPLRSSQQQHASTHLLGGNRHGQPVMEVG